MRYKLFFSAYLMAFSISLGAHEMVYEAPWEACEEAVRSDQCAYQNGDGDLFRGTCQSFNEALMCVRNQPIIYASSVDSSHQLTHEHSHDETSED